MIPPESPDMIWINPLVQADNLLEAYDEIDRLRLICDRWKRRAELYRSERRASFAAGVFVATGVCLALDGTIARFVAGPAWQYLDGLCTLVERILHVIASGQ